MSLFISLYSKVKLCLFLQLELILVVGKLQELRSIRIQKLKKQGKISRFVWFIFK